MDVPPASGQMDWVQALAGPLAGATCLWQDLDGLHVEPAPGDPPYTSIVWGWRPDSWLVRVRLDGALAFVVVHDGSGGTSAAPTVPWDVADLRVAASKGRGPEHDGVGTAYEQIIVDGITGGAGPVTFIRPARDA
jgi:hypothetical protein